MLAVATVPMMLSVIIISIKAAGIATPLASGAVSTQNSLASTSVAVVAATKSATPLVTPSDNVADPPARLVVQ